MQRLRDPFRALDDMFGAGWRAGLVGGLAEKLEPALEMRPVYRQRDMRRHRAAMIGAGHQGDRMPERDHLLQMWVPILDPRGENRPKHGVFPDFRVKLV